VKHRSLWTYLPSGPLLSLLLVGLVLLSGLLYYRAVRIQRYLEPALALSQPRNAFSEAIQQAVKKEFGRGLVPGFDVRTSSLVIDQALLVSSSGRLHPTGRTILHRFARVFKTLLDDAHTKADINLVLISAGYASGPPANGTEERVKVQRLLEVLLDGLFEAEPLLRENYQAFFATAPRPIPSRDGYRERIEFRIIPSEMLHIEFLQRLQKYAQ
jgi:hypothetical protein